MINMTKQEMFDQAVGGLIKQGRRAHNKYGDCKYRTDDGLKCAFGMLIPDEIYNPKMEGWSVTSWMEDGGSTAYDFTKHFSEQNLDFGEKLQEIHDSRIYTWDEMLDTYKKFAIEQDLKLTVFEGS